MRRRAGQCAPELDDNRDLNALVQMMWTADRAGSRQRSAEDGGHGGDEGKATGEIERSSYAEWRSLHAFRRQTNPAWCSWR